MSSFFGKTFRHQDTKTQKSYYSTVPLRVFVTLWQFFRLVQVRCLIKTLIFVKDVCLTLIYRETPLKKRILLKHE